MCEMYNKILNEYILNELPEYMQVKILNILHDRGIINNKKRYKKKFEGSNIIDVCEISKTKEKLELILKKYDGIIKECQEFDYFKAYRFSSIFKVNISTLNNNYELINDLCKKNQIIRYTDSNEFRDNINTFAEKPTYRIMGKYRIFKFTYKLMNREDNTKFIKYPVLMIIDNLNETLEVRLDLVSFNYKNKEDFYKLKIQEILSWTRSYLKLETECIDFEAIVKYINNNKKNEVTVSGLEMRRDGMSAKLHSSSNDKGKLPILTELKDLLTMEDYLFNKTDDTKKIKSMLETLLSEIDENSTFPSSELYWNDKMLSVNVVHGYKKSDFSLFRYKGELTNKEDMNYVTEYLIASIRELEKNLGLK